MLRHSHRFPSTIIFQHFKTDATNSIFPPHTQTSCIFYDCGDSTKRYIAASHIQYRRYHILRAIHRFFASQLGHFVGDRRQIQRSIFPSRSLHCWTLDFLLTLLAGATSNYRIVYFDRGQRTERWKNAVAGVGVRFWVSIGVHCFGG